MQSVGDPLSDPEVEALRKQVARVVSLDHDGEAFDGYLSPASPVAANSGSPGTVGSVEPDRPFRPRRTLGELAVGQPGPTQLRVRERPDRVSTDSRWVERAANCPRRGRSCSQVAIGCLRHSLSRQYQGGPGPRFLPVAADGTTGAASTVRSPCSWWLEPGEHDQKDDYGSRKPAMSSKISSRSLMAPHRTTGQECSPFLLETG